MILKDVSEHICVFCQRDGDSFISSFACPSFIYGHHLSGVLCASRRSAVLLESEPAALCLLKCREALLLTLKIILLIKSSTGRTMISREPLLVKSD